MIISPGSDSFYKKIMLTYASRILKAQNEDDIVITYTLRNINGSKEPAQRWQVHASTRSQKMQD